ncbi:hypothetical protein BL127_00014345 [Raoultella planticola]|nr:hypothetical protein BL127_00014345 [Raoultella planticola]
MFILLSHIYPRKSLTCSHYVRACNHTRKKKTFKCDETLTFINPLKQLWTKTEQWLHNRIKNHI